MATVVTSLTPQEVATKIAAVDPPTYAQVEAAALRKLNLQLPNYQVTKVEVTTVGNLGLRFTITYTPKLLDAVKAKAALRH